MAFKFTKNTFSKEVRSTIRDRIEIEIGDSKQPDFKPQFKVMRWNNEVNFSMRAQEHGSAVVQTVGEVIKYITPHYEVHQYEKPEASAMGGFEFEWVLNDIPASNTLFATIESKNLDFFYQPPLTQQEINDGHIRPDNIVGSYAVYHKTKGRWNDAKGNDYKTGKAFHIYRPKAVDAAGDWIWCELDINVDTGLLGVTINKSWLKKAMYPVIVDPTFGYDTVPGSFFEPANDQMRLKTGTSGAAGTGVSVSAYTKSNGSGTTRFKGIITSSALSILTNGIGPEQAFTSATEAWRSSTFSVGPTIAASTNYHAGIVWTDDGSGVGYLGYDSGGASGNSKSHSNNYASPVNPTGASPSTSIYAIYATYDVPSSEVTITKSMGYAIISDQSKTKGLQYTLLTEPSPIQKGMEYVIKTEQAVGFITRTDVTPASVGSWQTVSKPAGVPDTASGLIIHIENPGVSSRTIGLRKKGSTDNRTMVHVGQTHDRAFVGLDSNGDFEAYVEYSGQVVYVEGWFEESHVAFLDNSIDISPGTTGSWQDVDITSHVVGTEIRGAIVEIVRGATAYEVGLRKKGSTDDRHPDLYSHSWMMIGVDSNKELQAYIEHADVEVHLIGYVRTGFVFNTNATDLSPTAGTTYEERTLDASAAGAFVEVVGSFNEPYLIRKDGDTDTLGESRTFYTRAFAVCEVSTAQKIEVYGFDTSVDMYLVAYPTQPVSQSTTKSMGYAILTSQTVQKGLIYRLLTDATPITKALAYFISNSPSAIQKALGYTVIADKLVQKVMTYHLVGQGESDYSITKSLGYAILTSQTVQKSMAYRIITTAADITKALVYMIIGSTIKTKPLSYKIIKTRSVQKTMTYHILGQSEWVKYPRPSVGTWNSLGKPADDDWTIIEKP